jgi:hypothetical protein
MRNKCLLILIAFSMHTIVIAGPRLIIQNGTLIDAVNPDRQAMTMIIEGDKILSIQSAGEEIALLIDDVVIDAEGKFVIPGLWDAHVHLTFIPELDYKTSYDLFLKNGITSIRDTGGLIRKMQPAITYANKNPDTTPRLFFAGPLIDGKDRVYKGLEPGFPDLSVGIDESSDIEGIVDELTAKGATFLKSYEMLSRPTYLKLLQVAEEKGLRVTGHIPLSIDLMEAIDAGLGGMQHIRNLDLACSIEADEIRAQRGVLLSNRGEIPGSALRSKIHSEQRYTAIENFDETRCNSIIEALAENDVYQTPTLTINTFGSKRFFADAQWRETYKFLPKTLQKTWQTESLRLSAQTVDPNDVIFGNWSMKMVSLFNENNIKILAGTDTPIGYLTPGYSLHKELELLVEAGLSPREALRSATIAPAEFFNLENKMGSLDEEKVADILILNHNPLNDIKNTQDIYKVILKGMEK